MIQTSAPIRQHILPRFYLRAFASPKRSLAGLNRTTGFVHLTNVKKATAKHDFYTIVSESGERRYNAEWTLGKVESEAARALRTIRAGTWPPEPRNRDALAAMVALQFTRGEASRDGLNRVADYMQKLLLSGVPREREAARADLRRRGLEGSDDEVDTLLEMATDPDSYMVQAHQNEHVRIMLSTALELIPAIQAMTWNLVRSPDYLFLTTDHPVALWRRPWEGGSFYGVGMLSADEIRFPLDPEYLLVLTPDGLPLTLESSPEQAYQYNAHTAASSHEWTYARPTHPHLSRLGAWLRGVPRPGIIIDGPSLRRVS